MGRDACGRTSVHRDAAHGSAGTGGHPLHGRLRDDAALLAEPGELPHWPVRAHQRHHRQHFAAQPRPRHLSARTAARRVRDRLLRQVAHGQRRQPAPRLHALGRHARTGRGHRPAPQRRRQPPAGHRVRDGRAHRLRRTVHPALEGPAVPRLSGAQGDPSQCHSAGRWPGRADAWAAGRIRGGRTPSRALRGAVHAAAAKRVQAAGRQAGPDAPHRHVAAARARDGDDRRRDARAGRDAAGRGRQPRTHSRGPGKERRARRHDGRVHERPRVLLWRARPERRAAARLRGDDPHSAAHPVSRARSRPATWHPSSC